MYPYGWCLFLSASVAVISMSAVTAATTSSSYQNLQNNHGHKLNRELPQDILTRIRRQSSRSPGIFTLFGQLISQTANETSSAYRQISQLVSDSFGNPPPTTSQDLTASATANTTASDSSANSNSTNSANSRQDPESEGDSTTTAAPYRASRNELMTILRRNLLGLRNLFMKEWRTALKDTNKNVAETGKQFRAALRPFITGTTNSTRR